MAPVTCTQVAYRLRNDDGSEAAATWKQNQNDTDTIPVSTSFRVRFLIQNTSPFPWTSFNWRLRVSYDGGVYTEIATNTAVIMALSDNFANGDDCTQQMTGGTGTFLADNNGMTESTTWNSNSGGGSQNFELEYCMQINPAQVENGKIITLRVYSGVNAINAYACNAPITVSKPSGYIPRLALLGVG